MIHHFIRCIFLLAFCCIAFAVHAQTDTLRLNAWRFTCPDPADTNFTASGGAVVPGCIHTDLLQQGLIPDPFYGTNEDSLQWLSDAEVTYSCEIWREDLKQKKNLDLVFEGVTGYAEVYLNGQPINHLYGSNVMDNAFRTWRFPLDGKLYAYNLLEVKFTPARRIIDQRKSKLSYTLPDERAFLRTPPYQAGWDWGPKLTTCGITGKAYILHKSDYQVTSLYATPHFSNKDTTLHIHIAHTAQKIHKVHIECYWDGEKLFEENGKCGLSGGSLHECKRITDNDLWYPNGMGEPRLHELTLVVKEGKQSYTLKKRMGLRNIKLRQEKDSIGQSFEFIVNGQATFMKGANWIPADFFPTNMTEERCRELLQACRDANMNMIRVWGGGCYEPDYFYDLCDELGIMVWQDFMFAGAIYPLERRLLQNVAYECRDQLERLSDHPCIALWCGNNEVKNGWEDWGWQADYTPEQREDITHNINLLFDTLLRTAVANYGIGVPYISTSPLWGWGHPECCTEGDSHYWGVWWGEEPFEMYIPKTGRFMSEFGFQSYPDMQTLKTVIPEEQLHLGSPAMNSHQKHARGVQIINKAMEQYFYIPENLEDYIYVSQLVQAYGTGLALQEHRRRMPYCMGSLFWQLNDCWPVASWSCIDYYGRRKALYYEAKRDFEPVIIACDTVRNDTLPIYVVNDLQESVQGNLQLNVCNFNGEILQSHIIENIDIQQNESQLATNFIPSKELGFLDAQEWTRSLLLIHPEQQCYLHIVFTDNDGKKIAEKVHFFVYPGMLDLPSSPIQISQVGNEVLCVSQTLQYGVELTSDVDGTFSDNYFILLPGVPKTVIFKPKGNDAGKIKARSLRIGGTVEQ